MIGIVKCHPPPQFTILINKQLHLYYNFHQVWGGVSSLAGIRGWNNVDILSTVACKLQTAAIGTVRVVSNSFFTPYWPLRCLIKSSRVKKKPLPSPLGLGVSTAAESRISLTPTVPMQLFVKQVWCISVQNISYGHAPWPVWQTLVCGSIGPPTCGVARLLGHPV